MRLLPAAAAALLFATAACGSSGNKADAAHDAADARGGVTTTTTAPPQPGQAPTPGTGEKRSSSPQQQPGAPGAQQSNVETTPGAKTMPIRAELARSCVRAGEPQTVTIYAAPESRVAYGASYADGTSAMSPSFHGGNNAGIVTDSGKWTDTWVVGATAPAGPVKVDIGGVHALHGVGQSAVSFTVAPAGQGCA